MKIILNEEKTNANWPQLIYRPIVSMSVIDSVEAKFSFHVETIVGARRNQDLKFVQLNEIMNCEIFAEPCMPVTPVHFTNNFIGIAYAQQCIRENKWTTATQMIAHWCHRFISRIY